MKKVFIILMAVTMFFGATGCAKKETYNVAKSINDGLSAGSKLQFSSSDELLLADVFQSGMMFQGGKAINVWGLCKADTPITVTLKKGSATVEKKTEKANGDDSFLIALSGVDCSFDKYALEVSTATKTIALTDILFGDLYLLGGQSNMQLKLMNMSGATDYADENSNGNIRFYQTENLPLGSASADYYYRAQFSPAVGKWQTGATVDELLSASAVGYVFAAELSKLLVNANKSVPIGFIDTSIGGTSVESWLSRDAFDARLTEAAQRENRFTSYSNWNSVGENNYNQITASYNLKTAPIRHMNFKGVCWYQGESNISKANYDFFVLANNALVKQYDEMFGFDGKMPFISVEVAPYEYYSDNPYALPKLWEAQAALFKSAEANVSLVTVYDLPLDYYEHPLHPKEKIEVGKRIALSVANSVYAENKCHSAPVISGAEKFEQGIVVNFDSVGDCLSFADGEREYSGFELVGTNGEITLVKTESITLDNNKIILNGDFSGTKTIRYNYNQLAQGGNIKNSIGFLLVSFSAEI